MKHIPDGFWIMVGFGLMFTFLTTPMWLVEIFGK